MYLPLSSSTVLFARAAVWDITPKMSQGRQAAVMLGAHPAEPGKVPSVHSQAWGQPSPCRAAAANGIFSAGDITTLFFSCCDKRILSVQGSSLSVSPRKARLGLVLGLAAPCTMFMAKPLYTGLKHLHKILIYQMVKESMFLASCDADCAPCA